MINIGQNIINKNLCPKFTTTSLVLKYKHKNIHCNTKYNNDLSFQDYSPHLSINLNYMYFQKGRNFNNKISELPKAFESITKCVMGMASQIAVVNSTLFRWNFVKDLFIILFSHLQIWRHLNDSRLPLFCYPSLFKSWYHISVINCLNHCDLCEILNLLLIILYILVYMVNLRLLYIHDSF